MVLTKESNTLNRNTTGLAPGTTQTVITTTTREAPRQAEVITKDAVITNVMEKPILENVIEKKNVEVHHKNVVEEIHEQKIIEIEKPRVVQNVVERPLFEKSQAATVYEEIGTGDLTEQERLRLQQLNLARAPKIVQQQGAVRQVQEGEQLAEVVRQEFIEHHVQPVVTEVREQNIVQEVVHPVVRKVHEGTIIREIESAPMQLMGTYTYDTGVFETIPTKLVPSATTHQNIQNPNMLRKITGAGKKHFYGLSYAGELYHLIERNNEQSWTHIPTNGIALKDVSTGRGGALFGIGLNNGALYRFNRSANGFELVFTDNNTRLSQISVQSKRKIYALGEDGSAFFIKLARFGHNHTWNRMGGKLKKISAGGRLLRRTEVWGLGMDGRAMRYWHDAWVPFNVQLLDISVAMDNAVYGVSMDNRLVKWNGHEQFVLQNREIKGANAQYLSNAKLTNVSAYKEGRGVYALEQGTSNLLRMISL